MLVESIGKYWEIFGNKPFYVTDLSPPKKIRKPEVSGF